MKSTEPHAQAFPTPGDEESVRREGMTMREWYAGQALAALSNYAMAPMKLAENAFKIADAMLAWAKKEPTT